MLPDFIAIKKEVSKEIISYLRKKIRYGDAFISHIGQKVQHEGHRVKMKTYDGHDDEIEYKAIGSHFDIKTDEIIIRGPAAFKEHIDKLADDILGQQSKILFQKLNEITEKTGNVVKGQGKPFTKEKLLEAMDKIDMEFDDSGQPINLTIVMSPILWDKVKEEIPKWEEDGEFMKKREAILDRKRREWLDRENNRELVD